MENVQTFPYQVRSQVVVVLDMVTKHSDAVRMQARKVTAENGKQFDLYNPFQKASKKDAETAPGVFRQSVKDVISRIVSNPYNSHKLLLVAGAKLAKNTNALAGFVKPLIMEVSGAFPFDQEYEIVKEPITITAEAETGELGESEIPGINKKFSDFVKVEGWANVQNESSFAELCMTTMVKVSFGNVSEEEIGNDLGKLFEVIQGAKENGHLAILADSSTISQSMVSFLVGNGFRIVTRNSPINFAKWSPGSRTAIDESLFRTNGSASGESEQSSFGDLLFVK